MKVENYLEGENPVTGEEVTLGKIPKYVLGIMGIIGATTFAQFGVQKLVELTGADEVQGSVPQV